MNEREFINKIESLKEIKADAEWASLTRDEILGQRKFFSLQGSFAGFLFKNRVLVAASTLVFFGVLFSYSQFLISSDQKQAREKEVQMLSVALADLKEARAEMDRNVAEFITTKPKVEAVKIAKEIAPLLLEIEEKEGAIMGSLGVAVEPKEISTSEKVASYLIADLEKRSLTEEDKTLLKSVKETFETGDHQEALKKVIQIGGDQEEAKDN